MPQLAPAVRLLVCGRAQTPSVDAVLALFAREDVLAALAACLSSGLYSQARLNSAE
jgi:glutamyl-tRNA synthetase